MNDDIELKMFKYAGIVILIILIFSFVFMISGTVYSDGFRMGVVQKISNKGICFKTYEGQLVMEGLTASSDQTLSNIWDFSVLDTEILDQLNKAAERGDRVKLVYHQLVVRKFWNSNSDYIVDRVEILPKSNPTNLNPKSNF